MKKGNMVLTLIITMIFAILLFAPLVAKAADFFSLKSQGKKSFFEFVMTIEEMEEAMVGERKSALLFMEDESGIVFFKKDQGNVLVNIDYSWSQDARVIFERPSNCNKEEDCLCWFGKFEESLETDIGSNHFITINMLNAVCQPIIDLKQDDCGVGEIPDSESYTCVNGFVIENIISEAPARNAFTLTKEASSVLLELQ